MNKQILEWPNPILREKCREAVLGSPELSSVLEDLTDTFSIVEGYGLAAPQIGHSLRAIVINTRALGMLDENKDFVVMINPVVKNMGEIVISNEACFSVPDISISIKRNIACDVSYIDESGVEQEMSLDGLPSFCIQHEVDHLDGITIMDKVSRMQRSIVLKKKKKRDIENKKQEKEMRLEFEKDHQIYTLGEQADTPVRVSKTSKKKKKAQRKARKLQRKRRK